MVFWLLNPHWHYHISPVQFLWERMLKWMWWDCPTPQQPAPHPLLTSVQSSHHNICTGCSSAQKENKYVCLPASHLVWGWHVHLTSAWAESHPVETLWKVCCMHADPAHPHHTVCVSMHFPHCLHSATDHKKRSLSPCSEKQIIAFP